LINHNQLFFSHSSVIGQFIASDFWLMAYCRKLFRFRTWRTKGRSTDFCI